jgi:P27 family predicted phage terminase small subunit
MARGRRKPAEQHRREGTWRADRHPEPLLIAGRPDAQEWAQPPEHIPEDGKVFWRSYVVRLIECGIVDRVDLPLVEMMAVQYARVIQAGRAVAEKGHISKGSKGQIREAPWVKIERDATMAFWRIAEGFGIGPIGRTRLGLAELHRRALADEMREALGPPKFEVIDGSVDED